MEPVYFDQLFKKNNRGNYIQRDKALPINWRHHDRIIGLWLKNHPVEITVGELGEALCPTPGNWSRGVFEDPPERLSSFINHRVSGPIGARLMLP